MIKNTQTLPSEAEQRREARKEKRRTDIVNAALEVFSQVGFAAAKIEDVADAAGISKGTLYLYFESKEELFKGMIKAKMLPFFEEAEAMNAVPSESAEDRLRALTRFFYSKVLDSDRRQIMRLIMAEGPNFPEITAFYHANILSRGQAMIQGALDYGVETGEFRKMEQHGILQNVMAGAIAASIWKEVFDQHDPIDLEAYNETHMDLILRGLKI